ncbi:MAG: hypothetical protein ABSF83_12825 [Nitrososphaerales archaeon]
MGGKERVGERVVGEPVVPGPPSAAGAPLVEALRERGRGAAVRFAAGVGSGETLVALPGLTSSRWPRPSS